MAIDDRALEGLLEASQDLHCDALRHGAAIAPDLADARNDARRETSDPEQIDAFNDARRAHVDTLGLGKTLQSKEARSLAGSIQIIDAQQVAILNDVLGEYPVPDVFASTDVAASP